MGGSAVAEVVVLDKGVEAPAAPEPVRVGEMRLPGWYFGFEGVVAGAFDLLRAVPGAWPVVVGLLLVNVVVSLTVLRKRLGLAKLLWRGKGTRRLVFALFGLRLGSHVVLAVAGQAADSTVAHLLFALLMGGATVATGLYVQRTSLAALVADGRAVA